MSVERVYERKGLGWREGRGGGGGGGQTRRRNDERNNASPDGAPQISEITMSDDYANPHVFKSHERERSRTTFNRIANIISDSFEHSCIEMSSVYLSVESATR